MRAPSAFSPLRGLRKSRDPQRPAAVAERPDGVVVWVHCADEGRLADVPAIASELTAEGDAISVVATCATDIGLVDGIIVIPIPADTSAGAQQFLDTWKPDALIWARGQLRPALISATAGRNIPSILLNVTEDTPSVADHDPDAALTMTTLKRFRAAICATEEGQDRMIDAGMTPRRAKLIGPFDPAPPVLPCREEDRDDLAGILGSRPVWFANRPTSRDLSLLATAYRIGSQRAHRLLLVVACDDTAAATDVFRAEGLLTADRTKGEDPHDAIQVMLTDLDEMGLWYRLAPLTFLGGTFEGRSCADPFDAATLGSVVIYGMYATGHMDHFGQLADATASRMVRDADTLGQTVEELMAPDKAAEMAHAAWDVTSRGADVTEKLVALVHDALDGALAAR